MKICSCGLFEGHYIGSYIEGWSHYHFQIGNTSTKIPFVPRVPRFEKKASIFKGQKGKRRHKDSSCYLFTPFVTL